MTLLITRDLTTPNGTARAHSPDDCSRALSCHDFPSGAPLLDHWLGGFATTHSRSTTVVYARALRDYLHFLARARLTPEAATLAEIQRYVADRHRRCCVPCGADSEIDATSAGLARSDQRCAATVRVTLTALRSYYDVLAHEHLCASNPLRVPRIRLRALALGQPPIAPDRPAPSLPRNAWIPTRDEIRTLARTLAAANTRDRLLVALIIEAALSTRQVCGLRIGNIARSSHHGTRLDKLPCQGQSVPLCPVTTQLYRQYLRDRPNHQARALLLSTSNRNWAQAISASGAQKALRRIARKAGVRAFTGSTLSRLRKNLERLDRALIGEIVGVVMSSEEPHALLLRALFGEVTTPPPPGG